VSSMDRYCKHKVDTQGHRCCMHFHVTYIIFRSIPATQVVALRTVSRLAIIMGCGTKVESFEKKTSSLTPHTTCTPLLYLEFLVVKFLPRVLPNIDLITNVYCVEIFCTTNRSCHCGSAVPVSCFVTDGEPEQVKQSCVVILALSRDWQALLGFTDVLEQACFTVAKN
jgi:hypothetical protein